MNHLVLLILPVDFLTITESQSCRAEPICNGSCTSYSQEMLPPSPDTKYFRMNAHNTADLVYLWGGELARTVGHRDGREASPYRPLVNVWILNHMYGLLTLKTHNHKSKREGITRNAKRWESVLFKEKKIEVSSKGGYPQQILVFKYYFLLTLHIFGQSCGFCLRGFCST